MGLNFRTGYSPTWEEEIDPDGNIVINHRPPYHKGARLGGYYRMRAYPLNRFYDHAVIYTCAEYRYTPHWNPLGNISC